MGLLIWQFPVYGGFFFGLSAIAIIGKCRAFLHKKTFGTSDIHLWETITMGLIPIGLVLSGSSITMVTLSLYPGLFLHKLLINIGSGIPLFDNQTNDITGKTFDINLPTWVTKFGIPSKLNIPRTTQRFRFIVALTSTIAAILVHYFIHLPSWWIFNF
jgi:hypothetical protein